MGGSNLQGISPSDYTQSFSVLANKDDYKYNIITAPGLMRAESGHATVINTLINNTQNRGDAIAVIDLVKYGQNLTTVTAQAAALNTSYAAAYWPWVQIVDPDTQNLVWVPASTVIPGVYAYSDNVSAPWFAPAGINRGGLSQVILAERKLSSADRDTLYTAKINPIATFPATGVVVFGQKTLQTKSSALDRVNVRRLLITLKNTISNISNTLVFEQNTLATRNNFLAQVNPYLESVQQRQGLYAYKVIMDDSNNTPDVVDRNQLRGAIYLQPTKTAEFIILDFNILPTGATFPA
jgi:phage tail sheath protein FI